MNSAVKESKRVSPLGSRKTLTGFDQLDLLTRSTSQLPKFTDKLAESGLSSLTPTGIDTLQINLGKMCNQTCQHCHVDAGPHRREIMTKETFSECLRVIEKNSVRVVDLTGGAPEMNPHFRDFVQSVYALGVKIIDRCNLTIILANKSYHDLPEFLARHKVHVVSSLPCYGEKLTDLQRGSGVFKKSIQGLQMLNEVGYGRSDDLQLDLAYNPAGTSLPGPQKSLETDFKKRLKADFDIDFSQLLTITNMPISRYLQYLDDSGSLTCYMTQLVDSFNAKTAPGVMCRNMISVSWDGFLYDCDFNQMLDLKVATSGRHISEFRAEELLKRTIVTHQHCYGCTAGIGSSCSGSIV